MEIKDETLYNILQMNEGCPTADCNECDYQLEDNSCNQYCSEGIDINEMD